MNTSTTEASQVDAQEPDKAGIEISAPFTENERVQILIAEYNTLRSELIAAGNKVYNILAVGSVDTR